MPVQGGGVQGRQAVVIPGRDIRASLKTPGYVQCRCNLEELGRIPIPAALPLLARIRFFEFRDLLCGRDTTSGRKKHSAE